jgi:hypothetical protein
MVDADQRLEGGPKPLCHPVRRPDIAGLNENPFTQDPGHPLLFVADLTVRAEIHASMQQPETQHRH